MISLTLIVEILSLGNKLTHFLFLFLLVMISLLSKSALAQDESSFGGGGGGETDSILGFVFREPSGLQRVLEGRVFAIQVPDLEDDQREQFTSAQGRVNLPKLLASKYQLHFLVFTRILYPTTYGIVPSFISVRRTFDDRGTETWSVGVETSLSGNQGTPVDMEKIIRYRRVTQWLDGYNQFFEEAPRYERIARELLERTYTEAQIRDLSENFHWFTEEGSVDLAFQRLAFYNQSYLSNLNHTLYSDVIWSRKLGPVGFRRAAAVTLEDLYRDYRFSMEASDLSVVVRGLLRADQRNALDKALSLAARDLDNSTTPEDLLGSFVEYSELVVFMHAARASPYDPRLAGLEQTVLMKRKCCDSTIRSGGS